MKKRTICFLCFTIFIVGVFTIVSFTSPIEAHNSDYFAGTYDANAVCSTTNMKFFITTSAQNSILNASVYSSATAWNSISSKVNISNIVMQTPGMPYLSGFYYVYGSTYYDGTLGETLTYNGSTIVSENSTWTSVAIYMNSNSSVFPNETAGKKTFIHEVGHALKLKHPLNSVYFHGPQYYGYPKAIMNQGIPNTAEVASSIQQHDIENLKAKWEN